MKNLLADVWKKDKKALIGIICLNIALALTGSVGTVMLVPMLDLLEVDMGSGALAGLMRPLADLSYLQRAVVIIGIFVAVMLAKAVLTRSATVLQNKFLERYEMGLRSQLYSAIAGAHWETLARKKHSDLVSLFTVQCRQSRMCLQWIISLFSSFASAAMQLAIACWLSLPVTVLVLVVGVSFLMSFRSFQSKSKECGKESVKNSRAMYFEIQNQLSSIKETRAYGVEEENKRLFNDVSQAYYDISLKTTQLQVMPQLCYSVASAVLIAFAFVISVLVLKVDTASLVVLVYIFSRLWPVFSGCQAKLQNIASSMPSFDTLQETVAALKQNAATQTVGKEPLAFAREVKFDKVSFSYRDGTEPVLVDVSFSLPYGSVTALCGRSGAGKSTSADLLLGLLQPTAGQILIDGVALTQENAGSWRRSLGYVPQSPLIIDASIRENLRRFHPEATEEEMVKALKDSLAWEFVEKLPEGLDTVLGTKGIRLSGGEQQRIVLARVLLGNPRLIILDEATSALDYESEAAIRQTIQTLKGKTTVLIIAHRLATIRGADRAVVLEDRRVAESGSLTELLSKDSGYLANMLTVE